MRRLLKEADGTAQNRRELVIRRPKSLAAPSFSPYQSPMSSVMVPILKQVIENQA
jgi:hypothetical protein